MSTLKTNAVQVGQSGTATNNFTLYQPTTPDGTVRLGNGNVGAVTDKVTINSNGNITAVGTITAGDGITATAGSGLIQAASVQARSYNGGQLAGLRNRIINGDFTVNQRSITTTTPTGGVYTADRWLSGLTIASKYSVTISAIGSGDAGNGASGSAIIFSSLSNYAVLSSDFFILIQRIEGYNISDFQWGTAAAKTVTLSFYVKSSLTGTFGGSIRNGAATRSYPFTYSIPVANTLTRISVTIPGDTTGAFADWPTTSGIGLQVSFSLGAGATLFGTAGAWAAGNYVTATGAVSVVATNTASLNFYNVQLEVGPVATPFEQRPYGMELALCQRYFEVLPQAGTGSIQQGIGHGQATSTTNGTVMITYKVTKRAVPMMGSSGGGAAFRLTGAAGGDITVTNLAYLGIGLETALINVTVASGLQQGNITNFGRQTNTTGQIEISAEL